MHYARQAGDGGMCTFVMHARPVTAACVCTGTHPASGLSTLTVAYQTGAAAAAGTPAASGDVSLRTLFCSYSVSRKQLRSRARRSTRAAANEGTMCIMCIRVISNNLLIPKGLWMGQRSQKNSLGNLS